LPPEAKDLQGLFCLQSTTKPKTLRQCLFCHQQKKHCWSYFAISWAELVIVTRTTNTWIGI